MERGRVSGFAFLYRNSAVKLTRRVSINLFNVFRLAPVSCGCRCCLTAQLTAVGSPYALGYMCNIDVVRPSAPTRWCPFDKARPALLTFRSETEDTRELPALPRTPENRWPRCFWPHRRRRLSTSCCWFHGGSFVLQRSSLGRMLW